MCKIVSKHRFLHVVLSKTLQMPVFCFRRQPRYLGDDLSSLSKKHRKKKTAFSTLSLKTPKLQCFGRVLSLMLQNHYGKSQCFFFSRHDNAAKYKVVGCFWPKTFDREQQQQQQQHKQQRQQRVLMYLCVARACDLGAGERCRGAAWIESNTIQNNLDMSCVCIYILMRNVFDISHEFYVLHMFISSFITLALHISASRDLLSIRATT